MPNQRHGKRIVVPTRSIQGGLGVLQIFGVISLDNSIVQYRNKEKQALLVDQ